MPMTKTRIGTNPDGSPHFLYDFTCPDGHTEDGSCSAGLLLTGPISGTVALKDGTAYSVTPEVIEFAHDHEGGIQHHIEKMHEAAGYNNGDFKHVCTDRCGAEADTVAS